MSGRKSRSALASSRCASPICSGRAGAVRSLCVHRGAGRGLDLRHRRRMVAMRMGDEDVRDRLAAHGIEQRRDVGVVVGAGVKDRDLAAADDVADRACEGERAGIVGHDRPHVRRDLFRSAGYEIEALVIGDVVAHAEEFTRHFGLAALKHDPEKWKPVFRKDHAPPRPRSPLPCAKGERKAMGFGAESPCRKAVGRARRAPKIDGAPVPGSPGLQAISFNTSCEIEIAHKAMQAVGQVGPRRNLPKYQGVAVDPGTAPASPIVPARRAGIG